jgi:Winged helix-turn helix
MVNCTKKQIRELKTALRWKIPEAQRQRIQMVLLRESGMTQPTLAEAMGVSLSTVNRAHMAFDHGGIQALKPKPIRQRENMTSLAPLTHRPVTKFTRPFLDFSRFNGW